MAHDSDDESDFESDTSVPLVCEVCDTIEIVEGIELVVTDTGSQLPDTDDAEWYLHLHTPDGIRMESDETDMKRGVTDPEEWYMFCPECKPSKALPTADEDPQFDIDIFIEQQKDALDDE